MNHSTDIRDVRPPATDWRQVAAVFVLFFVYSALCRPVPSVNEPHYLTKARHVWQPAWCDGDFFLNSSIPHLAFYRTVGALTDWLTLPQAAWIGRAIALLLLAWGWTRLLARVSDARWVALGSACWFLLLQSLGSLSGEWVVGGVESKVFAYALAFAGWASLIDARPLSAGVCLGLAISFHPVVGGWCVIAAGMALGSEMLFDRGSIDSEGSGVRGHGERHLTPSPPPSPPPQADSEGSRNAGEREKQLTQNRDSRPWIAGGLLLLACALPGLIPAVQSLGGVDPQAAALADRYQVGTRLAHHLDPLTFPLTSYRYYGLLLVVWLLMRRLAPHAEQSPTNQCVGHQSIGHQSVGRQSRARQEAVPGDADRTGEGPLTNVRGSDDDVRGSDVDARVVGEGEFSLASPVESESTSRRRRLLSRIMLASLVIALAGVLIASGPRPIQTMPLAGVRIWLLKFYPFRLADLLVPLVAAVALVDVLALWAARQNGGWRSRGGILLTAVAFLASLWLPHPDKNPSRMTESKRAEWIAACEWIRTQTPPDALVQAANEHWAVKWFSHRAEFVNYKDCPQDSAGILEWARRLKTIRRWQRESLSDGVVSADELQQLHDETGITHLLVSRLGPIEEEPLYRNGSFRVYAIGE